MQLRVDAARLRRGSSDVRVLCAKHTKILMCIIISAMFGILTEVWDPRGIHGVADM